jgi:phosphotransferase system HPr (HPr) family protein
MALPNYDATLGGHAPSFREMTVLSMSEDSPTRVVTVANREGLHLRAAVMMATTARRFQAKIELWAEGRPHVIATDVLQMTALGCMPGERIRLVAAGPDAEAALDAMAELFARKFDEDSDEDKEAPPSR